MLAVNKRPMIDLPSDALSADNLVDTVESSSSERWNSRLHSDLHSLKRTETNIGEELGGRRTSKIDPSLVLLRTLLTRKIRVELLEELVAAVFEGTLD